MNTKVKLLAVTSIAALCIPGFKVFSTEPDLLSLITEIAGFIFSYLLGSYFFKNKPFKCVPYIILGAFIGITVDIIAFPTVRGYERNLFPIEVAVHLLVAAALSSGLAFISLLTLKLKGKNV